MEVTYIAAAVSVLLLVATGEDCQDLNGAWYNELGSEMMVTHTEKNVFTGEYRTAVERKPGAAGASFSVVRGVAEYGVAGAVIGFSVFYSNGGSTAAFLGQCLLCEGEEVIMSSWMLRVKVDSCSDKWKSVLIGRNYFTRHEQNFGPRKRFGTHTPQGYEPSKNARKKRSSWEDYLSQSSHVDRTKRDTDNSLSDAVCTWNGDWFNERGSKVTLVNSQDRQISGSYRTPNERQSGKDNSKHGQVFGVANPDDPDSTGAIFVNWNKGDSITAWTGQCHECEDWKNKTEVLETAWLHRSKVDTCNEEWKATVYGENTFYRTDDIPIDEISAVVGEFGEIPVFQSEACASSAASSVDSTVTKLLAYTSVTIIFCKHV